MRATPDPTLTIAYRKGGSERALQIRPILTGYLRLRPRPCFRAELPRV